MPIEAGQQLLHYRLVDKIGEGGMGVVWKAVDTTLDRDVAIKVLPDAFARDAERLARFEREAKLLASLNHANIASVYGLHREGDTSFLAMELVSGEDLAARIARGPLGVEDSLTIAVQIADALEAAHEQGVIHRDLKPANVRVMPDGKVKVLDFGLAKALLPEPASGPTDLALSPTITSAGTQVGTILGTAAYMSPEQASGLPVDRRADIWAFGVVLCEMLTGKRTFRGETTSHVLASVIKDEVDLSQVPAATPAAVRRLLRVCVEKKPRRRLQAIGDARVVLEDVLEGREPSEATVSPSSPRKRMLAGAAVVVLLLAAVAAGRFLRPAAEPAPLSRLSVTLPEDGIFATRSYPGRAIDVTRDGRTVVFGTDGGLRIRRLDDTETRLLPDSVGAGQPTFSPDGRWIAFFDEQGLKKIPVDGGKPVTILAGLPNSPWLQLDWSEDGRIVFDTWNAGLRTVPADGGDPEVLTDPEEEWNLDPQVLPGGKVVLYFAQGTAGDFRIEAIPVDGGTPKPVLDNASHPRYLTSGHLLFVRDGLLMVAPFDRSNLEVTGPAVVVPVEAAKDHVNVAAPVPQLAISDNGTLVYAPDPKPGADSATLVRLDRKGNELDTFEVPLRHPHFSISPDGARIAVSGRAGGDALTYVLDVERKTLTRLLSEKTDYAAMAVWASDGSGVYFARYGTHECEVWFQPIDGGAPRRLVTQPGTWSSPVSVSADGRYLAYFSYDTETQGRIWYLDLEADAADPPSYDLSVEFGLWPMIAPDGRWIAFHSWSDEIQGLFVRRFPDGTLEQRVAPGKTNEGCWSADGRELFYRTMDDGGTSTIKVVSVTTDPALRLGAPRELFRGKFQRSADSGLSIAVFPDGESLLLVPEDRPHNTSRELVVVQNWFREIEAIAPSR